MVLALLSASISSSSCFFLRRPLHFSTSASPLLLSSGICNLNTQRSLSSFIKNKPYKVSCIQVKLEDGINDEACELVNGVELSIGEGVDSIRGFLFTAEKNNSGTGILLLYDIFGFEDSSTRDFAYRVACNGYNVLVPDLFRGDPWSKDRPKTMFEQWLARQDSQRMQKTLPHQQNGWSAGR